MLHMEVDDKLSRTIDVIPARPPVNRPRRALRYGAAALAVVLLAVGATAFAFRRASDHLDAIRRDTAASADRVAALGNQLAHATTERDRSLHEAALARAAYDRARDAHAESAAALRVELADLETARRQAYASIVDANTRGAQFNALRSCLDGVWQALDMLGVGDVNGWQQRMQSVAGVCNNAQGTAA